MGSVVSRAARAWGERHAWGPAVLCSCMGSRAATGLHCHPRPGATSLARPEGRQLGEAWLCLLGCLCLGFRGRHFLS
jgi:hypothetical protein